MTDIPVPSVVSEPSNLAPAVTPNSGGGRPFLVPFIADLEGESFEDSAAQLAEGSSFHAAPDFAFHHDQPDSAEVQA